MVSNLWKHKMEVFFWGLVPDRLGGWKHIYHSIADYNVIAMDLLKPLSVFPEGHRVTLPFREIAEVVNRVAAPSRNPARDLRRWLSFMRTRQGEWFLNGMGYGLSMTNDGLEVRVLGRGDIARRCATKQ